MKPVVSIVGRPNVGKSTLFNRIIGKREAIVDDEPGITRDRKTGEASWEGIDFILVDTGGYIPKTRDVIEAGVTRQVNHAIREADLVLFLVDAQTGITDVDADVARLLRKSQKPCVVAVNKVDHPGKEYAAAEFIRLGLGEPSSLSAAAGLGIGDLLSRIVGMLGTVEKSTNGTEPAGVRFAVVGRPNVGKSTFINAVLGEERVLVTEIPGTTRDAVDVRFKAGERDLVLIDTAGIRRQARISEGVEYYSSLRTRRVIERCDVAAVFADGSEALTQQDIRIIGTVISEKKGVLLVINKWDLVKDDPEKVEAWDLSLDLKMQGLGFIPILTVSSLTKWRIQQVIEKVLEIALEREKRIPSPELNRFLEKTERQQQHPSVQGKRVRILYGSQVGTAPPRFAIFSNYPDLIQENYLRFLENKLRERFGFEGVPLTIIMKKK